MSEYTPTTEHVRAKYARGMKSDGTPAIFEKWGNEFDLWLADHDAKVRAEALREAAAGLPEAAGTNCGASCHEADRISLRDRADRIERGEQA